MKVDRFQQATCLVLSQLVRRSAFEQPDTDSGKPWMALCPDSREPARLWSSCRGKDDEAKSWNVNDGRPLPIMVSRQSSCN